jgi:hypothetical protein
MKAHLIAAAIALALPLAAAHAQTQTSAAKAKKKPVAAKHAAASHPAAKKKAATGKRRIHPKTAKAVEAVTPVQSLSSRLTTAELETAKEIYTGTIQCELGASVKVMADERNPGFFNVTSGKQRYYMHPVESRTGAIRMEDGRAGAIWLQLGNKSMLMDQKKGQRVADECITPEQREFAAHMGDNPDQLHLLDGPAKPAAAPASSAP